MTSSCPHRVVGRETYPRSVQIIYGLQGWNLCNSSVDTCDPVMTRGDGFISGKWRHPLCCGGNIVFAEHCNGRISRPIRPTWIMLKIGFVFRGKRINGLEKNLNACTNI